MHVTARSSSHEKPRKSSHIWVAYFLIWKWCRYEQHVVAVFDNWEGGPTSPWRLIAASWRTMISFSRRSWAVNCTHKRREQLWWQLSRSRVSVVIDPEWSSRATTALRWHWKSNVSTSRTISGSFNLTTRRADSQLLSVRSTKVSNDPRGSQKSTTRLSTKLLN